MSWDDQADDANSRVQAVRAMGLAITTLASTREVTMEARENICNVNALRAG